MPSQIIKNDVFNGMFIELAPGCRYLDCGFVNCEFVGIGGATFKGCDFRGTNFPYLPEESKLINCMKDGQKL